MALPDCDHHKLICPAIQEAEWQIARLRADLARVTAALEWYADGSRYLQTNGAFVYEPECEYGAKQAEATVDRGLIAREALGK